MASAEERLKKLEAAERWREIRGGSNPPMTRAYDKGLYDPDVESFEEWQARNTTRGK